MARSKGTVKDSTNVHRRKLRSSTSTAKVSETNCNVPSTSSSVQQGNSSSKKRKVQASSTEVVGSGTKTPKISKQDKDQQPEPGSSNSKYSVINLHSSFKEHSGRSKSPPINFKVNILKPVQDHRPTLPRFKRTPVQNPAMCADVAENILDMCFEQEERYTTSWDYMIYQPSLSWRMREILVDWIVDVHAMMKLAPPTLWLTVNLIDRTLAQVTTKRDELQLVGIGALSLACKLEEIAVPYPDDFTYITEDAFKVDELMKMELTIWKAANYELIVPTGYNFLVHFLDTIHASDVTRSLAMYYAERNLQETTLLACRPSVFAAACLYAAMTQRVQQGEPICSDLTSDPREQSPDPMDMILDFMTNAAAAAEAEATAATTQLAAVTAADGTAPAVTESSASTADAGDTPAGAEDMEITPIEQLPDAAWMHPPDDYFDEGNDSPTEEPVIKVSRDVCLPTEVVLWGIALTRRAPVRHVEPSSQRPPRVPGGRVATFSPSAASSSATPSGAGPNGSSSSVIILSAAASAGPSIPTAEAAKSAEPVVYEVDVTEEVIRRGAERIAREVSPEDASELLALARAIVAVAAAETVCATHRHLNAARRKYATSACMCVSELDLPFASHQEATVPTTLHGPVLIPTGGFYFMSREHPWNHPASPHHFPLPADASAVPTTSAINSSHSAATNAMAASSSSNASASAIAGTSTSTSVGGTIPTANDRSGTSHGSKRRKTRKATSKGHNKDTSR